MEEELSLLQAEMHVTATKETAGRVFYEGQLDEVDVVMVLAKIGKVAAAITATTLLLNYDVDSVILTGTAGAIDPKLDIGDIVIAQDLMQHDLDASPIFPKYEIPLLNIDKVIPDNTLTNKLTAAAINYTKDDIVTKKPKVVQGTILSGDQFIKNPKDVIALKQAIPTAQCVEMEGAAIAQVCHEFNTPFTVMRVISDKADHSADISFTDFLKIASKASSAIIKEFLHNL